MSQVIKSDGVLLRPRQSESLALRFPDEMKEPLGYNVLDNLAEAIVESFATEESSAEVALHFLSSFKKGFDTGGGLAEEPEYRLYHLLEVCPFGGLFPRSAANRKCLHQLGERLRGFLGDESLPELVLRTSSGIERLIPTAWGGYCGLASEPFMNADPKDAAGLKFDLRAAFGQLSAEMGQEQDTEMVPSEAETDGRLPFLNLAQIAEYAALCKVSLGAVVDYEALLEGCSPRMYHPLEARGLRVAVACRLTGQLSVPRSAQRQEELGEECLQDLFGLLAQSCTSQWGYGHIAERRLKLSLDRAELCDDRVNMYYEMGPVHLPSAFELTLVVDASDSSRCSLERFFKPFEAWVEELSRKRRIHLIASLDCMSIMARGAAQLKGLKFSTWFSCFGACGRQGSIAEELGIDCARSMLERLGEVLACDLSINRPKS